MENYKHGVGEWDLKVERASEIKDTTDGHIAANKLQEFLIKLENNQKEV